MRKKISQKGVALITVLFIVMALAVIAMGYLQRSGTELQCGENIKLRSQMDRLAESGLQHAKGMILNPQEVSGEYWTGASRQQIDPGHDFYDVNVVKDSECEYTITCKAYRENIDGDEIAASRMCGKLRLDPCFAMRTGSSWNVERCTFVYGDVYCVGNVSASQAVYTNIYGDLSALGQVYSGVNTVGQQKSFSSPAPISYPNIQASDFGWVYYIGSVAYTPTVFDGPILPQGEYLPTAENPAGIIYVNHEVQITGNTTIFGSLIVNGDLKVTGSGNTIVAMKNFPAIVTNSRLLILQNSTKLNVSGLVYLANKIEGYTGLTGVDIYIEGALVTRTGDIEYMDSFANEINVAAAPDKAALEIEKTPGSFTRWSPASGAFYRTIERY